MPRGPARRRNATRHHHNPRVPPDTNARSHLERKLANVPVGQRPTDSDDSDRLVVKGNGRSSKRKQEIYASGAVRGSDRPGALPTRAQRRKNLSNDTEEILAQAKEDLSRRQKTKNPATSTSSLTPLEKSIPALPSSTIKTPRSAINSIQPTPLRENSILGTLKPRRRQPSILQHVDHDSSSFDSADEEQFLPDDESTPLHLSTAPKTINTPATTSTQPPSSRKRKLGHADPFLPNGVSTSSQRITSPMSMTEYSSKTPESALPALPLPALRDSDRRRRNFISEPDDVMAPPESSSATSSSPAKPEKPAVSAKRAKKTAEAKSIPLMTTQELQAAVMPTKRRRTARDRKPTPLEFNIAADSDSPPDEREDDSNFVPQRKVRNTARRTGATRGSNKDQSKGIPNGRSGRAVAGKNAAGKNMAKTDHKQSTRESITTITTSTSTSTVLSPPNVRKGHATKSSSQLSSSRGTTTNSLKESSNSASMVSASAAGWESKGQYGGSRTLRLGRGTEQDKENFPTDQLLRDDFDSPGTDRASASKVLSHTRPVQIAITKKTTGTLRGKWADIDAWDMEFEDVEVMTTSGSGGSSPTRR